MAKLKLRPWHLGDEEEAELYWLGAPCCNYNNDWMIKALFKSKDSNFIEEIYPWATLPALKIGQKFIDGMAIENKSTGSKDKVKIPSNPGFEIRKGFDLPKTLYPFGEIPYYGNQLLCMFSVNNTNYYIPCIEIIRSIIAPYSFLLNRLSRPGGLRNLIVNRNISDNELEIDLHDEYLSSLLNDEAVSYFTWLVHNEAASKEWNFINRNMIKTSSFNSNPILNNNTFREMPVQTFPPMNGESTWTYRGIMFYNNILILELIHRTGVKSPFRSIFYSSPKFYRTETDQEPGTTKQNRKIRGDVPEVELIDTDESAIGWEEPLNVEGSPVSFSFQFKPYMRKIRKNTKLRHLGISEPIDSPEPGGYDDDQDNNQGTTRDWAWGGKTRSIEFAPLLSEKKSGWPDDLKKFLETIEYIKANYKEYDIKIKILRLPGKIRILENEKIIAVVKIKKEGFYPIYLIESGRSDSTSTLMIIPLPSTFENKESLILISFIKKLIDNSMHWSMYELKRQRDFKIYLLRHLIGQNIEDWAKRIIDKFA